MGEWWIKPTELDKKQKAVIALPPDGNYLVVGPPGSGKTNLLLLRAKYLIGGHRPNVVVLTFTKFLRNFMVRGSASYGVASDKVRTIHKWEKDLLSEHGIAIERGERSFAEFRREMAQRLADVFDQKPNLEKHLDCILVDEVQDCVHEEIKLFLRAAKNVFFVGDHRQRIYEVTGTLDLIESLGVVTHTLPRHYRNGRAICKVADAIGKTSGEESLFGTCNYDEAAAKSSAEFQACRDADDQIEKLVARLQLQLKTYPGELLGVACAYGNDVGQIRETLRKSSIGKYVLEADSLSDVFNPDAQIVVCTMHEAKGAEFRALHLPFMERVVPVGRNGQKRLAFTAVTRAKTALTVYSVASLPGYLEAARETTLAESDQMPTINDLFEETE